MSDSVWVCEQTFVPAQNTWTTSCGYRDVTAPDQSWIAELLTSGWFIVAAYVVVGLILGRFAVTIIYRREGILEFEEGIGVAFAALLWPLAVFAAAGWWFMSGGMRRDERVAEERVGRARQLRVDAREWDTKRHTGTEAEREMATELARLCRQQADDLESA